MNLAGALPLFAAIPEAARALSPHVNLDTVHDLRTAGRDASARACPGPEDRGIFRST
jgi:hypothetical protein